MIPAVEVGEARIFLGDCREILRGLADNSVDSVVTDPPYELGFMGKKWDSTGIAYDVTVWEECLRVLKPGGHVLAFGGSRTWHRMAVAIEDAGFEIRDSIAWMYGSGFPKSLNVSKAIDKAAGAEREVVGLKPYSSAKMQAGDSHVGNYGAERIIGEISMAHTPQAQQWEGWGTALKPAFEPIVVGRKPFAKGSTVAQNVLEWGVGGLNIDGSRIGAQGGTKDSNFDDTSEPPRNSWNASKVQSSALHKGTTEALGQGRWPANVILDEYSAGLLDEQSGVLTSGALKPHVKKAGPNKPHVKDFMNGMEGKLNTAESPANSGGASRFFYCAKASKRDRNEGLGDLPDNVVGSFFGNFEVPGNKIGANPDIPNQPGKNTHPTVKPTTLMRYLIKLVTPAGGTVLDPFTGSGSTGKAALLDGYKFVGAELTEEYLPIIEGRLTWAQENTDTGTLL